MHQLLIAKYTLIELIKKRLIYLHVLGVLFCCSIAGYAAGLVLTDKQATMAAFYSFLVRLFTVAVLSAYIILTEMRGLEPDNAQNWLSLSLSRRRYLLEKLLAYAGLAIFFAVLAAVPLLWIASAPLWQWLLGLLCELVIVLSLALLLSILFRQPIVGLTVFAVIYLFSRGSAEFFRHSSNVLANSNSIFEQAIAWFVKTSTYLVPKLEWFAPADWFLHSEFIVPHWGSVLTQTLVYSVLLLLIALERLLRREF